MKYPQFDSLQTNIYKKTYFKQFPQFWHIIIMKIHLHYPFLKENIEDN